MERKTKTQSGGVEGRKSVIGMQVGRNFGLQRLLSRRK